MLNEHEMAPDFRLQTDEGNEVSLSDFRGRKVILYFYPRADTPGCTTQACEFRDSGPQITEAGAVVLGISPDSVKAVSAFKKKFDLNFTLLADENHEVAEAYGVWGEKKNFGKTYMGVDRTTFLIDEEGRISRIFRKVTPAGHAGLILSSLDGE